MDNFKITCDKNSLTDNDREVIQRLSNEYRNKIERHVKNITAFDVYVKCHEKQGNVKRFRIDARVISPGNKFEASAEEYNLHDSVNEVFKKLVNEIEHKLHSSDQNKK